MDNQEDKDILRDKINTMPNYKKITTDNMEITLFIKKQKNPAELLEKLYILRNNDKLSNQEKNEIAKKIMMDFMRWFILEKVKHSLLLNISNQANTIRCRKTNLSQFNFIVILGLEYLKSLDKSKGIPISINIDEEGDLSINGIPGEVIDDRNIYIYTDKKITESD